MKWFGVRTIFEHMNRAHGEQKLYEERIVIVRAVSHDVALAKAKTGALSYASNGVKYLGYETSFEMFEAPGDGREVFSLMRDSTLDREEYISRFFDTGSERLHK